MMWKWDRVFLQAINIVNLILYQDQFSLRFGRVGSKVTSPELYVRKFQYSNMLNTILGIENKRRVNRKIKTKTEIKLFFLEDFSLVKSNNCSLFAPPLQFWHRQRPRQDLRQKEGQQFNFLESKGRAICIST